MANGWDAKDARQLGDYAEGVNSGKAYKVRGEQWRSDIMAIWEQEEAEGS